MSGERWRQQLAPDLAVLVDDSLCIVLEAGLGDEPVRVTLTNCDRVADALMLARTFVQASEDDEWSRRRGMHTHDGYAPHSHEVRADHLGVGRAEG